MREIQFSVPGCSLGPSSPSCLQVRRNNTNSFVYSPLSFQVREVGLLFFEDVERHESGKWERSEGERQEKCGFSVQGDWDSKEVIFNARL